MISVKEAHEKLLSAFEPLGEETAPLAHAAGRILARPITAPSDLPRFVNSSMDGFAVRAASVRDAAAGSPVSLRVVADVPAGKNHDIQVGDGEAARIMTGAKLPDGADAVIPIEDTDQSGQAAGAPVLRSVQVMRSVNPGDYLRPQGQDVYKGELLFDAGKQLNARDIGLLAMAGVSTVWVVKKPRIGLLSSGDELVEVGKPLEDGQIYDANTILLSLLTRQAGGEVIQLGIAADREDAVQSCLDRAVEQGADLILSSAGVSVGAYDFIRSVVEKDGLLEFWRVNVRPGKPLVFGRYRGIPMIGLPGNPVSAFVGFELFVLPVIKKLGGDKAWTHTRLRAKLKEPISSDGRETYFRAVVSRHEDGWQAQLIGHQGSGNLRALVQSNAFLIVPSEVKYLPIGAEVEVWMLDPGKVTFHEDSSTG